MTQNREVNAGDVTVNNFDSMSDFEQMFVMLIRHADKIVGNHELRKLESLPKELELFVNKEKNYTKICDLINILALHYRRPIVRHQPACNCVGADENIFANLMSFSIKGQIQDAILMGSFLVKTCMVSELVRRAIVVADLCVEQTKNSDQLQKALVIENLNIH